MERRPKPSPFYYPILYVGAVFFLRCTPTFVSPARQTSTSPLPLSLAASFSRTNHPSFVWVAATWRHWVGFRDDREKAHLGEENSALKLRLEGQRRAIHELEHQAYTLREEARVQ